MNTAQCIQLQHSGGIEINSQNKKQPDKQECDSESGWFTASETFLTQLSLFDVIKDTCYAKNHTRDGKQSIYAGEITKTTKDTQRHPHNFMVFNS